MNGFWETATSSNKNDYGTPQDLFDALHAEFNFEIDLCASATNAKLSKYLTEQDDFIEQANTLEPMVAFMNPPYQKGENACRAKCVKKACQKRGFHRTSLFPGTRSFVKAAFDYAQRGATVVCLLPARTGNEWFHRFAIPYGEIRFLPGRLTFEGAQDPAAFDSLICIFRPKGDLN